MSINKIKILKTIDTLSDALGNSDDLSIEEILSDIRDEGIDVDAALDRLRNARLCISMEARRSELDSAREKRLKLSQKGHEFVGKFSDWTKDQIIGKIKELGGPKAGFAYRDLESMGKDEMVSILEDLEMAHSSAMERHNDSE